MDRSRSRRYSQVVQFYSDWCDACNEEDENGKIACLLKTAIELESSRIEDLTTATNLSRSWIAMVHARMERSGIWANGRVDLEEVLTCSLGRLASVLVLHSLVANGTFVRTEEQRDGQYVYKLQLLKEKPASPEVQ